MSYTPHTADDVRAMLASMGVASVETLFDELPSDLPTVDFAALPDAVTERALSREVREALPAFRLERCFAGAGAYPLHTPAAVSDLISRGEFLTSYTPYQAEASQGQLQVIYEFQTMMAHLLQVDAVNASMYDAATSLVEALLMAVRVHRGKRRHVMCPMALSPGVREVVVSYLRAQGIDITWLPVDEAGCTACPQSMAGMAACVVAQPNYFGVLETVAPLIAGARDAGALVIAFVDPLSAVLVEAPGAWPEEGADIVCGHGQHLGLPLSYGGPYFGFLGCKQAYIRQLPGRLVGRTVDQAGEPAFTLTLQAREQHIRRAKATSNICTNQGLMVTAATIYLSLMGPQGLRDVVEHAVVQHAYLAEGLRALGCRPCFEGVTLFESAWYLPQPASQVIAGMAEQGFVAGVDLHAIGEAYRHAMLICTTEVHLEADCDAYLEVLASVLHKEAVC